VESKSAWVRFRLMLVADLFTCAHARRVSLTLWPGRAFLAGVDATPAAGQLMAHRITAVFGLSDAGLGEFFGVPRETASLWLVDGIPAARQGKAVIILEIANLLTPHLRTDRISTIARRPAEAYGGRTMLEMIAASGHEELLDLTRASVAFGTTA